MYCNLPEVTCKTNVDACTSFGKYVCENHYRKENYFKNYLENLTSLYEIENEINEEKLKLFSEAVTDTDNEVVGMMKKFFQACMNLGLL